MTRLTETVQNLTFGGAGHAAADATDHETLSYDHQDQNGYYDSQYQYYQESVEPAVEAGGLGAPEGQLQVDQATEETTAVVDPQLGGDVSEAQTMQPYEAVDQTQTSAPMMFNPADYSRQTSAEASPVDPVDPGAVDPLEPPPPMMNPVPPPDRKGSFSHGSRRSSLMANTNIDQPPPLGYYQPQGHQPTLPPLPQQGHQPTLPPMPQDGHQPTLPPLPQDGQINPVQVPSEKNNNVDPAKAVKPTKPAEKKPAEAKPKKSGWFGGIFGKLLKPGNQIHLPDDSNKTIYFDDKLGRWVNKEGDVDTLAPVAPPPMDPSFASPTVRNQGSGNSLPGGSNSLPGGGGGGPVSNGSVAPPPVQSFRAPKRKGRGYVDVFGQSGASKPITTEPPMLMNNEPTSLPAIPAIFNPSLLQPSTAAAEEPVAEQSSLPASAAAATDQGQQMPSMPMMFNPSSMASMTDPPTF